MGIPYYNLINLFIYMALSDLLKVPKPAGPTPPAGGQTEPPGAGRRVGVLH